MLPFLVAAAGLLTFSFAAVAQTRDCPTVNLTPGEAVAGALEATDCRYNDIITASTSTSYVKRYRLEVPERAVFTLTMSATAFAPVLVIGTTENRALGSNVGTADGFARVAIHLPPGSYYVYALASRTATTGAFELKAAPEKLRDCPVRPLPAEGNLEGAFTASTCRFLDLLELSTNESNVAFYGLAMPRQGELTITADTAISRFTMGLTTPSLASFGGQKQLTVSLPAGAQLVSVSSLEQGSYTLRTKVADLRTCDRMPIKPGEEATGKLELTGCRWLDLFVPNDDASPINLYRFAAESRTIARLDQSSLELDSYLAIFDANLRSLASNDDANANTSDSSLTINLPPGEYLAGASGYDEAELGAYTLKLTAEPPRTCGLVRLVSGETATGQVPETGCRALDLISLGTATDIVAPFAFENGKNKLLSLRLENAPASAIRLVTPEGSELLRASTDRNGEFPIEFQVRAGQYPVLVSTTAAVRPQFRVRALFVDLPDCPAAALGLNAEAESTITSVECRYLEIVPHSTAQARARPFRIELTERGRLAIEAESAAFPPVVALLNDKDQVVALNAGAAAGKASIAEAVYPAGIYRIVVVTSNGAPGAFKVRTALSAVTDAPSAAALRLHGAIHPMESGIVATDVIGVDGGGIDGLPGEEARARDFGYRPSHAIRRSGAQRQR